MSPSFYVSRSCLLFLSLSLMFLSLVVSPEEGGVSSRAHRRVVYHIYHISYLCIVQYIICILGYSAWMDGEIPHFTASSLSSCCEDHRIHRIEHPVKAHPQPYSKTLPQIGYTTTTPSERATRGPTSSLTITPSVPPSLVAWRGSELKLRPPLRSTART